MTRKPRQPGADSKPAKPAKGKEHAPTADAPLPEDKAALFASIWTLRDEGKSYRDIVRELGVSSSTVYEALHSDPTRLAMHRAERVEERVTRWGQHETESIRQAEALQRAFFNEFFDERGQLKKNKKTEFIQAAPRWAAMIRQSASDAARAVANLSRSSAEAKETGGGASAAVEQLDHLHRRESLIAKAIALNAVHLLPPELQVEAHRRIKAQDAEVQETPP